MAKSKGTGRGRRPQKYPPLNVILTGVPTRDYEQLEAEAIDALAEGLADLFIAEARAEVAAELGIEVSALPHRSPPFVAEPDLLGVPSPADLDGGGRRRSPRRAGPRDSDRPSQREATNAALAREDGREVTIEEAADILDLPHSELVRMIETGAIPLQRVGSQRVFLAEVLAFKRSRSLR